MASCVSCSNGSALVSETMLTKTLISPIRIVVIVPSSANNRISRIRVRASKQPRPIVCSSCNSKGHIECKWCGGTGFFILGDNMLCEIPSRNTTCIICAGKGSMCCSDCQGTGFRAKWLEEPPTS